MFESEHGLGIIDIDGFEMIQDTNQEIYNENNENEYDVYDPHIWSKIDGGCQKHSATKKQILRSAKLLLQLMKMKVSKRVMTGALYKFMEI